MAQHRWAFFVGVADTIHTFIISCFLEKIANRKYVDLPGFNNVDYIKDDDTYEQLFAPFIGYALDKIDFRLAADLVIAAKAQPVLTLA